MSSGSGFELGGEWGLPDLGRVSFLGMSIPMALPGDSISGDISKFPLMRLRIVGLSLSGIERSSSADSSPK